MCGPIFCGGFFFVSCIRENLAWCYWVYERAGKGAVAGLMVDDRFAVQSRSDYERKL